MFDGMTYEELNQMIKNPRSEPFEDYFEDMELSESEKRERIFLAEKMKNKFLFILIWLFNMQHYGRSIDWEYVRLKIETSYRDVIDGVIDLDDYMNIHIKGFSYDIIDSTQRNESDPYFYSEDRANLISENESNNSFSHQEFLNAVNAGKTMKVWIDMRDKRERETHRRVGGKTIPIQQPFMVGNSLMMYARDSGSFGAEPKEIVNCRCTTKYF